MRYRNPEYREPTETIHEGREFLWLLGGIAAVLALAVAVLMLASDWIAPRIPFAAERALAQPFVAPLEAKRHVGALQRAAEDALRSLGCRVAAASALTDGIEMTFHFADTPTVNAFATLGGHIVVHRGLIEKLPNEDALAAVLAHEIGHVRERHVIRAMGRGVVLVAALSAIGVKSSRLNDWALGKGGQLAALSFSRGAEIEADAIAIDATHRLYGHVGGVEDLFRSFEALGGTGGVELLRTHPLTENRLALARSASATRGLASSGARTPMPPALTALSAQRADAQRDQ